MAARSGDALRVATVADQVEVVRPRPLGRGKRLIAGAMVCLLGLALLAHIVTNPNLHWDTVGAYLFDRSVLDGVVMTLELTILSMVVGIALGILLAVMILSRFAVTSALASFYIWLFRGTPLLVQLIFWFNIALLFPTIGIGPWEVSVNAVVTPLVAALLGLGLNEAAYMAEIIRAGIRSVDHGQTEAALSVGLKPTQAMRRVILPQAMTVIIPPTGNQAIGMLKNTSLVSVIAAQELLTKVQNIYARNFRVIDLLVVACCWYLAMTTVATWLQSRLERRLGDPAMLARTAALGAGL